MSCTPFGKTLQRSPTTILSIFSLLTATMLVGVCHPVLAAAEPPAPPASVDAPKVLWHKVPFESEDADGAFASGIRAYNAGDYDLAIAAFSKALELRRRFADASYYLGLAFLAVQDSERAITEFNTIIETKPSYFDAYLELGRIYLAKGDIAKARINAETALKLKPNNRDAVQLIADIKAASALGK